MLPGSRCRYHTRLPIKSILKRWELAFSLEVGGKPKTAFLPGGRQHSLKVSVNAGSVLTSASPPRHSPRNPLVLAVGGELRQLDALLSAKVISFFVWKKSPYSQATVAVISSIRGGISPFHYGEAPFQLLSIINEKRIINVSYRTIERPATTYKRFCGEIIAICGNFCFSHQHSGGYFFTA